MFFALRREVKAYWRAFALAHKPKNVRGRTKRYGFLHIGKNAGSTIGDFLLEITGQGYRPPMVLGHDWTLELVARRYPGMKIAFLLRDPLERTISGFNSRLRQGRPRNQNTWLPEEATAFALFKGVEEFLDACISDDEYLQSAARYAQNSIQHVRYGYAFHFGGMETLNKHRDRIYCVGMFDQPDVFLEKMLAPLDINYSEVRTTLSSKHESSRKSSHYLSGYSESELARLRGFFDREYNLYDELKKLRIN
jgi:hypothetical protein